MSFADIFVYPIAKACSLPSAMIACGNHHAHTAQSTCANSRAVQPYTNSRIRSLLPNNNSAIQLLEVVSNGAHHWRIRCHFDVQVTASGCQSRAHDVGARQHELDRPSVHTELLHDSWIFRCSAQQQYHDSVHISQPNTVCPRLHHPQSKTCKMEHLPTVARMQKRLVQLRNPNKIP